MAQLDPQAVANLIQAILTAITTLGPLGVDLYLKLEHLFQLGPDEQANVTAAIRTALAADAETLAAIDNWKKQVGLSS